MINPIQYMKDAILQMQIEGYMSGDLDKMLRQAEKWSVLSEDTDCKVAMVNPLDYREVDTEDVHTPMHIVLYITPRTERISLSLYRLDSFGNVVTAYDTEHNGNSQARINYYMEDALMGNQDRGEMILVSIAVLDMEKEWNDPIHKVLLESGFDAVDVGGVLLDTQFHDTQIAYYTYMADKSLDEKNAEDFHKYTQLLLDLQGNTTYA